MQFIYLLTGLLLLRLLGCSTDVNTPGGGAHPVDTFHYSVVANDSIPVIGDSTTPLTNYEIARLSIGQPNKDSINHWLSFVGLPPNNPFCSAANCTWHEYVGLWHPKSGLARHWKTMQPGGMWVSAERVLAGYVIPAGSIVLYERVGTIFGHVGIVTQEFTGKGSLYISANTSPPGGSEFSGGGVYEKTFSIIPGASFKITGFIVYQ